ncbi:TIR domain-containing protein [Polaromonas sp. CF318]|uniref:TIR domain-containing protein n=1 Tax=Polaromonas sp. CF318 TaxID=1144318 RepID=UPI000270EB2A|nr:TIR domain-containing protein [Polaromonas sp. CF318]EJL76927.1 TIR domain-containing protein [Polaromonas sp. CF318]
MLKVFLSYASEDRSLVEPFYNRLLSDGFDPWIDFKKLLPGQNWALEIERAFTDANVVILFLSPRSVTKRGFVQREANDAMEKLRYKLPGDIYAIPLLLESCEVPSHISDRIQHIDLRHTDAWIKVRASLNLAAEQQKIELRDGVEAGPFRIYTDKIEETYEADHSHQIFILAPRFESALLETQAKELTVIFAGRTAKLVAEFRSQSWDSGASSDHYKGSDDLNDSYGIAFVNAKMLSLSFSNHSFFAGAAHGNTFFRTYNFALLPHLSLLGLPLFFSNLSVGLQKFSQLCLSELEKEFKARVGSDADDSDREWMRRGAGPKWENFRAFTFDRTKFTVLFPPYQVSAYALGTWGIDIPYDDLLDVLIPDGPHTLTRSE